MYLFGYDLSKKEVCDTSNEDWMFIAAKEFGDPVPEAKGARLMLA